MKIIPAIDLKNGKCVRLYKGNFDKETLYNNNPLEVAQKFESEGSKYLHIVDLDAAKYENEHNLKVIEKIAKYTNLSIQTGGGIRKKEQIDKLLNMGIDKVIIGSLAVKETKLVQDWLKIFGLEHIILAFDTLTVQNNPIVLTSAWQEKSCLSLWDILKIYPKDCHILCTDINKDGVLSSPNFELYNQILSLYPKIKLQASGGVSTLNDIKILKYNRIPAVIIGKAFYEKKFTVKESIYVS